MQCHSTDCLVSINLQFKRIVRLFEAMTFFFPTDIDYFSIIWHNDLAFYSLQLRISLDNNYLDLFATDWSFIDETRVVRIMAIISLISLMRLRKLQ